LSRADWDSSVAIAEGEKEKLVKLEAHLHERVVDQDEAIKAVPRGASGPVLGYRIQIAAGLLHFSGPTGVGKNGIVPRTLQSFLFDDRTP